jgi:hypothetical protein
VDPEPVLAHIPELFTFVHTPSSILRPKYDTREDRLSPINTFNIKQEPYTHLRYKETTWKGKYG